MLAELTAIKQESAFTVESGMKDAKLCLEI